MYPQQQLPPFLAPRLKIGRAAQHVAHLRGEVAAYMARGPIYILAQPHPEDSGYIAWAVRIGEGVPLHWAAMTGDIVHNLRAALDLLACDVVRLNGGDDDGVYFPFAKDAAELDRRIIDRMPGASPEAHDLVRKFQPYVGGNAVLRGIHDLDIHDKHRALLPMAGRFKYPGGEGSPHDITKPSESITGIHVASLYPDLKLGKTALPFALIFPRGGPFADLELIPTLEDIVQDFARVVDAFETLCLGTVVEPLTGITAFDDIWSITEWGLRQGKRD